MLEREIDAEAGWLAGHVDELWQAEQWGDDELAQKARVSRRGDFDASARVLSLLHCRRPGQEPAGDDDDAHSKKDENRDERIDRKNKSEERDVGREGGKQGRYGEEGKNH